jgi:hypothetical protein
MERVDRARASDPEVGAVGLRPHAVAKAANAKIVNQDRYLITGLHSMRVEMTGLEAA